MKTTTKTSLGCYVEVLCCTEDSCAWFYTPPIELSLLPNLPSPAICPDCGSDIEFKRGRFENETTTKKRWFGRDMEYTIQTAFVERNK